MGREWNLWYNTAITVFFSVFFSVFLDMHSFFIEIQKHIKFLYQIIILAYFSLTKYPIFKLKYG